MDNNYLEHHGIFGMKWGVRRYQNKDGTLTPAGRRRVAELDAERDRITSSETKSKSSTQSKRKISDMSDEELQSTIRRLQMEKQLADLTKAPEVKKGKSVVLQILGDSGKKAAGTLTTSALTYLGQQAVKNMFGNEVYSDMFNKKKEEKKGE